MKKNFKKAAALILALIMTFGCYGTVFAAELPSDVSESLSGSLATALEALMDKGAITGDSDGLFHPEQNLTRAQVCCMLVKLINPSAADLTGSVTVSVPDSGFTDMKGYGWAADYINYAAQNGIAKGYGNGTFKPGSDVTLAELVTFTVRAAGYTDEDLGGTWPANFLKKAEELGLYENMGLVTETGAGPADTPSFMQKEKATKEQAALLIYNAMEEIEKANLKEDLPQGTDKDNASEKPVLEGLVYADGSFNTDMTTFAGKDISKDVKVFVYGVKKEYSKSMTLSTKTSDYRETNIFKYKSVSTPAWYKLENGKITQLILPGDVGFSGKIYCVINDTASKVLNYDDQVVKGIETLTAGREITWLGKKDLDTSVVTNVDQFGGTVYELYARNGEITQIAKAGDPGVKGKRFVELATSGFTDVLDKDGKLLNIDGYGWIQVKENAAVYVLNDRGTEYEAGSFASVKKGVQVRLYDISDDDENKADIIVVKK